MPVESTDWQALRGALDRARAERDLCRTLLLMDHGSSQHFKREARTAIERIPALLREPAREPAAFRFKLQRLEAEMQRLHELAVGMELPPLAEQIEASDAALRQLLAQAEPTGDELLPVLTLCDGLLNSLRTVCPPEIGLDPPEPEDPNTVSASLRVEAGKLELALQQLAVQLATQHHKDLRLLTRGFADVPDDWYSTLYDVASQLLRNAAEHGIEAPEQRTACGKPVCGTIEAEFTTRDQRIELSFRDDGQGLDADRILDAGISLGMLSAQSDRDARRAAGLIFRAGLTTAQDPQGRGHGMQIVRERIRRLGGQIQISTKKGRYTVVRADLPLTISAA